jgi:prepilin-type N-terminal cleavage/methylation domain-containing protein
MFNKARRAFTLIEIMIVVLIIGILLAIAVPNFVKARESSRRKACIANLKQIEAAKQQWAMDNKKVNTDAPTWPTDLVGSGKYISGTSAPVCPSGGTYSVNDVSTLAACSKAAAPDLHTLDNTQI